MRYATLIKPWPALWGSQRRSRPRPYRKPTRGQYAVAMAFLAPLVLSLVAAYYAAYLYWVTLVTVVYSAVWAYRAVRSVTRAILRNRAISLETQRNA